MDIDVVLELVGTYGYLALFFCLFLGIVGLPINDETLVMLAGFVASEGFLRPVPTFLVTYAGVMSGMNIGFFIGRFLGTGLLDWLGTRLPRLRRYEQRAQGWLARYGAWAVVLTYYLPGVRHAVPYLVGIGRMPYWRFALIAFGSGFVWTSTYYAVGYVVGQNWQRVANVLHTGGLYLVGALAMGLGACWLVRRRQAALALPPEGPARGGPPAANKPAGQG